MNPRLAQLLGIILIVVSGFMAWITYQSSTEVGGDPSVVLTSTVIAWAIIGLPEFIIGLWLVIKGTRDVRVGDISGRLIPLVQKEGRISVDAAAKELAASPQDVADAAEKLATRRLPLVYLDRRAWEIVSPKAVTLKESLLHLLFAQRRMTFDQISRVTEASEEDIVDAMKELSKEGKFRGVIDENSRVIYTSEAVEQLPKAVTSCPNCGGKLERPVLPGEEERCPYCGHNIVNRVG